MSDRNKPEITPQKRSLKLTPILGDWTTYKPPRTLVKKVKIGLYGFDRLSEEELKQAHILHYNFAQRLCASLKSKLHAGCEIFEVDAFQNTYGSFLKSFTAQILQGKFTSSNYHDEIFISFDMQVVDSLINAALGHKEASKLGGRLSQAEDLIIDTVLENHLSVFYEIYKSIMQNIKFEKIGSPDIMPDTSIPPQSTFVYFVIEISVNNSTGKIIIGYNGAFLKNLLKKMGQVEKKQPLALSKLPPSIFNLVEQAISVTLGKTSLTMSDIQNLEVGDVVSFDLGIDAAIPISLDGHTILGQPGKHEGKFAVRVIAVEKEKSVKIAPPKYEEPEKELEENLESEKISESELPKDLLETLEEEPKEETEEELMELPEEFSEEDLEGSLEEENPEENEEKGPF